MKKNLRFLLGLMILCSLITACGSKSAEIHQTNSLKQNVKEKLHIVFVSPFVSHPTWLSAKDGFEQAAKDFDFRGEWVGTAILNADEMINQIEIAIAEKADGIITQGTFPEKMEAVLKKASEAEIPVVLANSDMPNVPRLAYIGTDPKNLGYLGSQVIIKKLAGKAPKVAAMVTSLDYKIGFDLVESYKENLSKLPGYEFETKVESLVDVPTAVQQWRNIFSKYPNVNVAINATGEAAAVCAKVVEEMNLQNKVVIIGIDDMSETLKYIQKGTICATMTQNFYRKGYQAAQWICEYVREGKKPLKLINDSGTIVVTKENIGTYAVDMRNKLSWK